MLDEDAVLEDRDLGDVPGVRGVTGLLPHHHDAVDGLAAGEELRLREDRGPTAACVPAVAAALALGFEPGGTGDALNLVLGGARLGSRLTFVDDSGDRVVLDGGVGSVRTALATTTTTATTGRPFPGLVLARPGLLLLGLRLSGLLLPGLLLLAFGLVRARLGGRDLFRRRLLGLCFRALALLRRSALLRSGALLGSSLRGGRLLGGGLLRRLGLLATSTAPAASTTTATARLLLGGLLTRLRRSGLLGDLLGDFLDDGGFGRLGRPAGTAAARCRLGGAVTSGCRNSGALTTVRRRPVPAR